MTVREQDILRKALELYERTIPFDGFPQSPEAQSQNYWNIEERRFTRGLIARLCDGGSKFKSTT